MNQQSAEKKKAQSILNRKSSKKRSVSKSKLASLKKKASEGSATRKSTGAYIPTQSDRPAKYSGAVGVVRAPIKATKSAVNNRSKSKSNVRSCSGTRSNRNLSSSHKIIPLRRVPSGNTIMNASKHIEPEINNS